MLERWSYRTKVIATVLGIFVASIIVISLLALGMSDGQSSGPSKRDRVAFDMFIGMKTDDIKSILGVEDGGSYYLDSEGDRRVTVLRYSRVQYNGFWDHNDNPVKIETSHAGVITIFSYYKEVRFSIKNGMCVSWNAH